MSRRLLLGLLAGLAAAASAAEMLYVGERILLGVYEEPDSQGARLMLLQSADQVEVLDRSGASAQVRTPNGTIGWVNARYLTEERPSSLRVAEVEDELDGLRGELQAAQEALREARVEVERLRTASGQAAAQPAPQPVEPAGADILDREHWPLVGGLAAAGLLVGFGAGAWWIDRRVRNRFSGMRPY